MEQRHDPHRYSLGTVPKRLRRRASLTGLTFLVPAGVVFFAIAGLAEGLRYSPLGWLVVAGLVIVPGVGALTLMRTLSPEDRAVFSAASSRTLEAVEPTPGQPASIEVPLRLSRRQLRRFEAHPRAQVIGADDSGLRVPGWLLSRTSHLAPHEVVTMPWDQISEVRVCSDSDGPDLYEVVGLDRKVRWRIARTWVTDEMALLDHIRSVGRCRIELKTSIEPKDGGPRPDS